MKSRSVTRSASGRPSKTRRLLRAVAGVVPMAKLAMHFHDTYGQALANLYAGMEEGARVINSAAGGLGGCPYARGATGNVATEDVVYMLEGMGIATGVDMTKLVGGHQRDQRSDRSAAGQPRRLRDQCEQAGGEVIRVSFLDVTSLEADSYFRFFLRAA